MHNIIYLNRIYSPLIGDIFGPTLNSVVRSWCYVRTGILLCKQIFENPVVSTIISSLQALAMLDLLVVFSLALLLVWYVRSWRHPDRFPQGPRAPLPLIGDGYILKGNFIKGFHDLRQKYGDIFGMWMGSYRAVVISDFDDMHNIFNRADCSLRIHVNIIRMLLIIIEPLHCTICLISHFYYPQQP